MSKFVRSVFRDTGSGDYIQLSEAAEIATKFLGDKKLLEEGFTEEDILKMGHLFYAKRPHLLRIYTFARCPIELKPIRREWLDNSIGSRTKRWKQMGDEIQDVETHGALTNEEMESCITKLEPGKCFELDYEFFGNLLMLRKWNSEFGARAKMRVESISGKVPNPKVAGRNLVMYWSDVLEADISPSIEVLWEDLRVDRQELLRYLDGLKKTRSEDGAESVGVDTIISPSERELKGKSPSYHLRFVAALLKALNVGDIRRTSNVAAQLVEKVEAISDGGPKQSWIEERLRELVQLGYAEQIKQGPESKI